jgi:hypothetical protein
MITGASAVSRALRLCRPALTVGGVIVSISAAACSDPVAPSETATVQIVFRGLVERRPDLPTSFQDCVASVLVTRIHPSWRGFAAVSMQAAPPDTWQITFRDVPINETVRFRINDKNWCDQNGTGAVLRNVSANGVGLAQNATTPVLQARSPDLRSPWTRRSACSSKRKKAALLRVSIRMSPVPASRWSHPDRRTPNLGKDGRDGGIRTRDPQTPSLVR